MLYYTTFPYNHTQLFSPDLGRFQSGSFVLEYEYMFVQVSEHCLLMVIYTECHGAYVKYLTKAISNACTHDQSICSGSF